MFGRAKAAVPVAGPNPAGRVPSGYEADIILRARPDVAVIARQRALQLRYGLALQGHTGTPYGYDKGDPANSLTGPVPSAGGAGGNAVMLAQAGITAPYSNSQRPVQNYADRPLADPSLDPYNSLLWYRMQRP